MSKKIELPFIDLSSVPKESSFIENYYRYSFAKQFVKNKTVLDIACGDGYGSDILSTEAKKVIGFDTSNEHIIHAQKKYKKENLDFLTGDYKNTTIKSHSIDVIVSFEMMTLSNNHLEIMHELKRLLKKDGMLIISILDKNNSENLKNNNKKSHTKNLKKSEFNSLISHFFKFSKSFEQEIKENSNDFLHTIVIAADIDFSSKNNSILTPNINILENILELQNVMKNIYEGVDNFKEEIIDELKDNTLNKDFTDYLINTVSLIDARLESIDNRIEKIEKSINDNNYEYKALNALMQPKKGVLSNLGRSVERKIRKARKKLFANSPSTGELKLIESQPFKEWALPNIIEKIFILTPLHTLFLANVMKRQLETYGYNVTIGHEYNKNEEYHVNFVLCAQIYEELPPVHNTVIVQLEQSVSSRWFNEKYFSILKDYFYIIDYNINNINFLVKNDIALNKIYYVPVGGYDANSKNKKDHSKKIYDFLFYGDASSSEHRQQFLAELSKEFSVKVCSELFGDDVYTYMNQSRCVINIHYYENALLETPRIFESLSMGKPVLSESSSDQDQYPELDGSVLFFKEDSIDDMLEKARYMINQITEFTNSVATTLEKSENRFKFMFNRFLVAAKIIQKSYLLKDPIYLEKDLSSVALSLPETVSRRYSCLHDTNLPDFSIYDGIRFQPGWQACAYSYKTLAQHFLKSDNDLVTIFEDDAFLLEKDLNQYKTVKKYLEQRKMPWDIYAGVIADLHDGTEILHIEEWKGIKFVTLNKMTSMVFNIYNRTGLRYLADWPAENEDVHSNTIDRYLESRNGINIITSYPFIAGHKEDLSSTLWGIKNDAYSNMIKESEKKLSILINEYLINEYLNK